MLPKEDPYSLSNFQRALKNVLNGCSEIEFPNGITKSSFENINLSPTHLALKIYPRNEQEQWAIELMEDVKVSYIPFNYTQVPDKDSLALKSAIESGVPSFHELNPHIEVYDEVTAKDGPAISESFRLPILYVVWPYNKPLPDTLDYAVDYEVFIPESMDITKNENVHKDVMNILETEAINLALGTVAQRTKSNTSLSSVRTITGTLMSIDWLLMKYIPLRNLKLRFQLGTKIYDTYVQADGNFSITNDIPQDATMSYVFQHPRWKLTSMNSTAPITITLGNLNSALDDQGRHINYVANNYPLFEAHHGADYFYNSSHPIIKWYYDSGIRIRVSESANSEADGVFTCSALNSAYITIYNNHPDDMYKCVSVLMHELGHFVHYGERGGYRMFTKVHDLITESFASYVGWLLGNKFYTDKGYTGNLNVIGNQSRQTWHKGMTGTISHYSPLFVDLVDDFNQGSLNSKYPTDRIENVPNSLISIIAEEDYDWNELKSRLQNYVGTYYTEQDLTTYLSNYEYWFSNN